MLPSARHRLGTEAPSAVLLLLQQVFVLLPLWTVIHEVPPSGRSHAVRGFPFHATLSKHDPIKLGCYGLSWLYLFHSTPQTGNITSGLARNEAPWALPLDLLSQTPLFTSSQLCALQLERRWAARISLGTGVVTKLSAQKEFV